MTTTTELVQHGGALAVQEAPTWEAALGVYLDTLNSPQTRNAYRRAIEPALQGMDVAHVHDLTPTTLTAYRADLLRRLDAGELAPATVKLRLDALRAFLLFCRLTGLTAIGKDLISFALKSPKAATVRPYQVLTAEERGAMLAAATCSRDYALVMLALGTGLRVSELCAVRVSDLYRDDDGAWWLRVVQGKGRKDRLVPLAAEVAGVVRAWIAESAGRDFVFPSRKRARLSTCQVWRIITDLARAAGIDKPISPHSLRHGYALQVLRAGASPVVVQKLLGHASLTTTQRYLDHLESAELRRFAPVPNAI